DDGGDTDRRFAPELAVRPFYGGRGDVGGRGREMGEDFVEQDGKPVTRAAVVDLERGCDAEGGLFGEGDIEKDLAATDERRRTAFSPADIGGGGIGAGGEAPGEDGSVPVELE